MQNKHIARQMKSFLWSMTWGQLLEYVSRAKLVWSKCNTSKCESKDKTCQITRAYNNQKIFPSLLYLLLKKSWQETTIKCVIFPSQVKKVKIKNNKEIKDVAHVKWNNKQSSSTYKLQTKLKYKSEKLTWYFFLFWSRLWTLGFYNTQVWGQGFSFDSVPNFQSAHKKDMLHTFQHTFSGN